MLLSKLIRSFNGVFENECRNTDMLAAACGIGVRITSKIMNLNFKSIFS